MFEAVRNADHYFGQAFPFADARTRSELVALGDVQRHAVRTRLPIDQGSMSRPVILVGAGKIETRASRGKRACMIQAYGPAELLGLHQDADEDVAYVAAALTEAVWMRRARFEALLSERPDLLWHVLEMQSRRLRTAEQRIRELAFYEIRERIWAEILRIAKPVAGSSERQARFTQQALADRVGSCRETVSEVCGSFVRDGRLVRRRPGVYILPSPPLILTA